MTHPVLACIGLGSNLDDPIAQVRRALTLLGQHAGVRVVGQSSLYRSVPWGVLDQPDFINAVAEIETMLTAPSLLDALLSIERAQGRHRDGERWGPRTIDLDLLLYGDAQIREPGLEVPHPRMRERAFVMLPLAELDPLRAIPGYGLVRDLMPPIDSATCSIL